MRAAIRRPITDSLKQIWPARPGQGCAIEHCGLLSFPCELVSGMQSLKREQIEGSNGVMCLKQKTHIAKAVGVGASRMQCFGAYDSCCDWAVNAKY